MLERVGNTVVRNMDFCLTLKHVLKFKLKEGELLVSARPLYGSQPFMMISVFVYNLLPSSSRMEMVVCSGSPSTTPLGGRDIISAENDSVPSSN